MEQSHLTGPETSEESEPPKATVTLGGVYGDKVNGGPASPEVGCSGQRMASEVPGALGREAASPAPQGGHGASPV